MGNKEYKGVQVFEINHKDMFFTAFTVLIEVDFNEEDTLAYIKEYVEKYESGQAALYHAKGDHVKAILMKIASTISYYHIGIPSIKVYDMVQKFNEVKGDPCIDGTKGIRLINFSGISLEPEVFEVKEAKTNKINIDAENN